MLWKHTETTSCKDIFITYGGKTRAAATNTCHHQLQPQASEGNTWSPLASPPVNRKIESVKNGNLEF
jgi:hypothetical protein